MVLRRVMPNAAEDNPEAEQQMNLSEMIHLLGDAKTKLESLDPRRIEEAQKKPSEHTPSRMSAAKKRLKGLYDKLTTGRSDATKVKPTGAKR